MKFNIPTTNAADLTAGDLTAARMQTNVLTAINNNAGVLAPTGRWWIVLDALS